MKKVIYIVKSELHIYPPCIAQIRMLKKNGVDCKYLTLLFQCLHYHI